MNDATHSRASMFPSRLSSRQSVTKQWRTLAGSWPKRHGTSDLDNTPLRYIAPFNDPPPVLHDAVVQKLKLGDFQGEEIQIGVVQEYLVPCLLARSRSPVRHARLASRLDQLPVHRRSHLQQLRQSQHFLRKA